MVAGDVSGSQMYLWRKLAVCAQPNIARFDCAGAGWALRPVHAPNTSLSAHTFCCSSCCSGFDFLQELQVSPTLYTCSIFQKFPDRPLCVPAATLTIRPGFVGSLLVLLLLCRACDLISRLLNAQSAPSYWVVLLQGEMSGCISPCYLCCLRIVKISVLLWASD